MPGEADTPLVQGRTLDARHILIRQAEMVTNLVNKNVVDDVFESVPAVAPVFEDWLTVQPDHVGHLPGPACRRHFGPSDSLKQTQNVVWRAGPHNTENVLIGPIRHLDHKVFGKRAEMLRQSVIGFARYRLKFAKRGFLPLP